MDMTKFLNTLFEPGEATCFTSTPTGTEVTLWPRDNDLWFCINPLDGSCDHNPTEDWHSPTLPRRADANVTAYRNILIELDTVPLEQQIALVRAKIPVTSIVFSGSKSYHFIVSLKQALPSIEDYKRVVRGIMHAIPEADKSTKNPSRLSRLPFRVRPETRLNQDLVYLGNRIDVRELPPPPQYHEEKELPKNIQYVTAQLLEVLHTGVDNYISAHFSGRNQFFYWLGKRCSELGHTRDQKKQVVDKYYQRLENKKGFSIVEAYHAARVKF